MKPENVRMVLAKLFDLNDKKNEPFEIDSGGTIRSLNFDELRDENFELLADIADFLLEGLHE